MPPRIVYSTDPTAAESSPALRHDPCVCQVVDLPAKQQTAYVKTRSQRTRRARR